MISLKDYSSCLNLHSREGKGVKSLYVTLWARQERDKCATNKLHVKENEPLIDSSDDFS